MKGRVGQFFNVRGLVEATAVLRNPRLARPTMHVPSMRQIDWAKWHQKGIRVVVLDKDNTLTLPYESKVHPALQTSYTRCLDLFGPDNVILFSNSAGSPDDKDYKEALFLEQSLGARVLRHLERKPGGGQELLKFCKTPVAPQNILVVGDRVLTDIVFANKNGFDSVLVDPLDPSRDNPVVRLVRTFERKI